MYPRESGVLYKSAVDSILALNNDRKLQGEYAAAVLEYLIYGQYAERVITQLLMRLCNNR